MASQLLQEDDLSESSLSICSILESVEVFLKSHNVLSLLVNGLPNNTVGSFPYSIHHERRLRKT